MPNILTGDIISLQSPIAGVEIHVGTGEGIGQRPWSTEEQFTRLIVASVSERPGSDNLFREFGGGAFAGKGQEELLFSPREAILQGGGPFKPTVLVATAVLGEQVVGVSTLKFLDLPSSVMRGEPEAGALVSAGVVVTGIDVVRRDFQGQGIGRSLTQALLTAGLSTLRETLSNDPERFTTKFLTQSDIERHRSKEDAVRDIRAILGEGLLLYQIRTTHGHYMLRAVADSIKGAGARINPRTSHEVRKAAGAIIQGTLTRKVTIEDPVPTLHKGIMAVSGENRREDKPLRRGDTSIVPTFTLFLRGLVPEEMLEELGNKATANEGYDFIDIEEIARRYGLTEATCRAVLLTQHRRTVLVKLP